MVKCHTECQIECQMECQNIYIIIYNYICQKECHIECRNTYQIECQIYCQNICQIEYQLVGITRRKYAFHFFLYFTPHFWVSNSEPFPFYFRWKSIAAWWNTAYRIAANALHLLAQLGARSSLSTMFWMAAEDARVVNHEPQMIPSLKLVWLKRNFKTLVRFENLKWFLQ